MSDCCTNNTWAQTVLDGLPGAALPAPELSVAERYAWARSVLDASPECHHLSHGSTSLDLAYTVGTNLTITKAAIVPIDCGYIGIGSLVFSTTNTGAVCSVVGQTCTNYIVVVIAQPKSLSASQITALTALTSSASSDSLGQLKTKYNNLLAVLKNVWLGV